MFYKHTGNDKVVVLIVSVNDIILRGNDETTDFREEKVSILVSISKSKT